MNTIKAICITLFIISVHLGNRTVDLHSFCDGPWGGLTIRNPKFATIPSFNLATAWNNGVVLGSGTFGTVKSAYIEGFSEKIAIKRIKVPNDRPVYEQLAAQEINILNEMSPTGVTPIFYGCIYDPDPEQRKIYIFQQMLKADLNLLEVKKFIQDLKPQFAIKKFLRLFEGIAHLNRKLGMCSNDIKPGNMMVDFNYDIHHIDMGLATPLNDEMTVCGTPGYMSPDKLDRNAFEAEHNDVYALAVSIAVIYTNERSLLYLGDINKNDACLQTSFASDSRCRSALKDNVRRALYIKFGDYQPGKTPSSSDINLTTLLCNVVEFTPRWHLGALRMSEILKNIINNYEKAERAKDAKYNAEADRDIVATMQFEERKKDEQLKGKKITEAMRESEIKAIIAIPDFTEKMYRLLSNKIISAEQMKILSKQINKDHKYELRMKAAEGDALAKVIMNHLDFTQSFNNKKKIEDVVKNQAPINKAKMNDPVNLVDVVMKKPKKEEYKVAPKKDDYKVAPKQDDYKVAPKQGKDNNNPKAQDPYKLNVPSPVTERKKYDAEIEKARKERIELEAELQKVQKERAEYEIHLQNLRDNPKLKNNAGKYDLKNVVNTVVKGNKVEKFPLPGERPKTQNEKFPLPGGRPKTQNKEIRIDNAGVPKKYQNNDNYHLNQQDQYLVDLQNERKKLEKEHAQYLANLQNERKKLEKELENEMYGGIRFDGRGEDFIDGNCYQQDYRANAPLLKQQNPLAQIRRDMENQRFQGAGNLFGEGNYLYKGEQYYGGPGYNNYGQKII